MPDLRASDADRERTVAHLRRNASEGRLTVEELTERSERAYAAVTVGDLAELVADLPAGDAAVAERREAAPRVRVRAPGTLPFTFEWEHDVSPEDAVSSALRHIAPPLHGHGYELAHREPGRLHFVLERRPAWTIVVAVLAFPFGLIALIHKQHADVFLDFDELPGGGTRVVARGRAPRRVRRAFAELAL